MNNLKVRIYIFLKVCKYTIFFLHNIFIEKKQGNFFFLREYFNCSSMWNIIIGEEKACCFSLLVRLEMCS